MPISDKHKIIFIHIPKNAGKSFEIMLGIHNQYHGSPNSRSKLNAGLKYLLTSSKNKKAEKLLMGVIDKSYAAQHLTLQEMILGNWLNKEQLNEYHRIAIVRDPIDRAYSIFNHTSRDFDINNVEEKFNSFLNEIPYRRFDQKHSRSCFYRQQIDYLRDLRGDIDSVKLLTLENLHNDWKNICEELGLKELMQTQITSKIESNNEHRTLALSDRNIKLIEALFLDDLIFRTNK